MENSTNIRRRSLDLKQKEKKLTDQSSGRNTGQKTSKGLTQAVNTLRNQPTRADGRESGKTSLWDGKLDRRKETDGKEADGTDNRTFRSSWARKMEMEL